MTSSDEPGDGGRVTPTAVATAAGEFFWRNRVYVVRDLLVAVCWVLVLTAAFVVASLPGWLYYVLLFGGLLTYSLAASLLGAAAKL